MHEFNIVERYGYIGCILFYRNPNALNKKCDNTRYTTDISRTNKKAKRTKDVILKTKTWYVESAFGKEWVIS